MTELDALLAACAAAPDDDAPRLVYADAIGGDAGELIVVQCDLARHARTPFLTMAEVVARRKRERELLAAAPLPAPAWCVQYTRGLITAAEIPRGATAESVARISPVLDALTMHANDLDIVEQLPQIRALDLYNLREDMLGDVPFDRLVAFGVNRSVTVDDELFLPSLPQLRALWLRCSSEITSLSDYPELVALDIGRFHLRGVKYALEQPLLELVVSANDPIWVGRSAARHTLVDLTIVPGNVLPDLRHLATLERLERLTLEFDRHREHQPSIEPLRDLAPSLRELRFATTVDPVALREVLRVLGPRLERVSLAQVLDRAHREEIEPLVAGELRDGDIHVPRALLGTTLGHALVDRNLPGYAPAPAYVLCPSGELRQLTGRSMRIGRGHFGNLVVDGNTSTEETEVLLDGDVYIVQDSHPTSATSVNGQRHARAEVRDGDTFGAAREVFRFFCGPNAFERARACGRSR